MKYFAILLSIIFIAVISISYEKKIEIFSPEQKVETLVKNISKNTTASTETNYEVGDKIEYAIIVEPQDDSKLKVDTNTLNQKIEIETIEVNGKEISKNDLENYEFETNSVVKIIGEAKINKNNDSNTQEEIIIIEEQKEENITEIQEENITKKQEIKNISNIRIEKLSYSSNIDNLIKIDGEGLEEVEFVNISDASFNANYDNGSLYILVEEKTISTGEHFVLFQLKNGEIYTYDKKINFKYDTGSLVIVDINPKQLKNDIDRNIILQGKGLKKIISIQLSNNLVLKDAFFNIINDNVCSLKIPKNLEPGTYTLNVMDTKGIYKSEIPIKIYK